MTVRNLVLRTKELANETKKYIERYNVESKRVNEELEIIVCYPLTLEST